MADWTETYRPTTLKEVRGNDSAVNELREWAETWEEHREAVILHGSPGVGKTSAAHALANDLGWAVIELNASDDRTADVIERVAGEAAKSGTLTEGTRGKKLVILDEADNIHGTYDRGGTRAITGLVKESSQPIILLANEFYEMSQGLRRGCREIEFRDIAARSILPVLRDISRREDIQYETEALELVAEKNSGDLRGAINDLQALVETNEVLTVEDVVTSDRDRTQGIFTFLDNVFKEEDAQGALRASYSVDETPDEMINWIEDNVPKDYEGTELATAYGFLVTADQWLGRVRATQNYRYWRYAADNMTAGVAAAREHSKGGWTRYGPPSYWRKLGSSRSTRTKRDYVARKIADRSGMSMSTVRRFVLPYLSVMTHHCKNRELTITMTAAYELDADHISFITGSGEETNKVQGIIEKAAERREEATIEHSEGAFNESLGEGDKNEKETRADIGEGEAQDEDDRNDTPKVETDETTSAQTQSGLTDFS